MKKFILMAIAALMSIGASAQLISSNTVTYKKLKAVVTTELEFLTILLNGEIQIPSVEYPWHGQKASLFPLHNLSISKPV